MFLIEPIKVIGYHGTTLESAARIMDEGFLPSQHEWEWLGHAVYFWQDAPYRAQRWPKEWLAGRRGFDGAVAVVAAEILLTGFVDLLDQQGMQVIKAIADGFVATNHRLRNDRARNRLDCAVFNFATNVLQSQGIAVDGYRAACVEGAPLTPGSPVYDLSHVQIAVINRDAILRKWILENDEGQP